MATFHPLDYLSLVRRRKWWIIVPAVVCIVGGALLALLLPRVYRSAATITMSSPAVSADLLKQAGPMPRDERVRAISEQLLSRAVLEQVVREEHLALNGDVNAAVDRLLQPNRIKVEPTQLLKQVATPQGAALDAFLLSYGDEAPAQAQRVTDTLARVFVEASSRTREARAEDTSAFVNAQLASSKRRLDDIEGRLRKAKEAYMGRLPEQTQSNLSIAAGMRQQLESTANSLRGEQDRLSMIERQIEMMKQGAADPIVAGQPQTSSAQMRVLQLQQELATARGMYTDKHPEIQRLQEDLAAARRDAEQERQRPEDQRLQQLELDPGYRQLLADRERARLRIRDLERTESQLSAQVSAYQARVEAAPMVEQQIAAVQREYDLEKKQFGDLTGKLQAAELNENLERRRGGEQFQVLYAAFLPRDPESPNVLRLLLLSVALGIGLGGAAAVGREYLDRSVHDVRALQAEFDVPVLGEISRIPRGRAA
jgi:polysaccharide chain length determinant protein (PEP-CTERM system associated)